MHLFISKTVSSGFLIIHFVTTIFWVSTYRSVMFPVLSALKKNKTKHSGPLFSLLDFLSRVPDLIPFLSIKTALAGFLCGSDGQEPVCNEVDPGSSPAFGRFSWRRHWLPTPVLPGEFHGQRSMAGYSPWGRKGHDWEPLILSLSGLDAQPGPEGRFTAVQREREKGGLQKAIPGP